MDNTTAAAAASAKAKERERDKMLQYPRMTMPEATKPADAHSSDSRAH